MKSLSPQAMNLIAQAPAFLPLDRRTLELRSDTRELVAQDPNALFPHALEPSAALVGLLLRLGCWAESHAIAQDLSSPEASYWHAIIHRIEPDSFNACYWFKRVGAHPIFPKLRSRSSEILTRQGPTAWRLKNSWDPALFIEWCEQARIEGGQAEVAALEIQLLEWTLLFEWCAQAGEH